MCYIFPDHTNAQNTLNLDIASGLSNTYVQDITQDIDGCFWFATEEGVNRFDGTACISPRTKDYLPLTKDDVNCILASKDSTLIYIGTRSNGLYQYNYSNHTLVKFPIITLESINSKCKYGISSGSITTLDWGEDNQLWIGHYSSGVDCYNVKRDNFIHYNKTVLPALKWESVWSLKQVGTKLFIGHSNEGLSSIDLKTNKVDHFFAQTNTIDQLAGNNVYCICSDLHGLLWCGTDQGLSLFNPKNNTFKSFNFRHKNSNLDNNKILNLKITENGVLYIGVEFKGIYTADLNNLVMSSKAYLEAQQLTRVNSGTTLTNFSVRNILLDQYNNVWIGTYGGGVLIAPHRTTPLKHIDYRENNTNKYSLSNPTAWGIAINNRGEKIVGTDGNGIDIIQTDTIKKRIPTFDNIKKPAVLCIHTNNKNQTWIGCYTNGLYLSNNALNKYRKIALKNNEKLDVRCFQQHKDTLFVGTDSGLFSLDINTCKELNYWNQNNSSLFSNFVRCICINNKNERIIGSYGNGMGIYNQNMHLIKRFSIDNGLPSNRVNSIIQDSFGNYWIGTMNGIVKFNPSWEIQDTLTIADGLSNKRIKAIIEKPIGQLWISTENGINNLHITENKVHSFVSRTIPLYGFKAGSVASDSSHIYFGSISGLWEFNPVTLLHEHNITHPRVTSIQIIKSGHQNEPSVTNYSRPYPNKLDYTQNNLEFTFNEADIALANLVKYSYRLKGTGDDWSLPSPKNTVAYRNLPPGKYTFELKSWTMSAKQNASDTYFSFNISPPFWNTWWFYLLMATILIIIITAILYYFSEQIVLKHNYEMEKQQREADLRLNEERMQFYTTVTHELRTPLTLILGPIHDLKQSIHLNEQEKKRLNIMAINADRLLSLTNQILELRQLELNKRELNVQKGHINQHVQQIFNSFFELNHKNNVKLISDIPQKTNPIFFDKEAVTIILYNLLNNAIKYTLNGTIRLLVTQDSSNNDITIQVIDTGIGIPSHKINNIYKRWYRAHSEEHIQGAGIGLSIVKSLIDLHKAHISINSIENEGTTFRIVFSGTNKYPNANHLNDDTDHPEIETSYDTNCEKKIVEENSQTSIPNNDLLKKYRILIVEDEQNIAEYISDSLASDYETVITNNGEEAVNYLTQHPVDLIISDLMMPIMNGIELCRQIRSNDNTSSTLFIMLTAQEKFSFKEQAYLAGADSYLTKPFSSTLLKSRIDNLIKKHEGEHSQAFSKAQKQIVKEKQETIQKELNRQDQEFIENARCLVLENIESGKVNVNFLADNLNMSTSTIYRKFKKILGLSTKEFISQLTMEKAEILLLSMTYNINEVSDMLGYSSTDYFRSCFKEHFGVSPTLYINQLKNKEEI